MCMVRIHQNVGFHNWAKDFRKSWIQLLFCIRIILNKIWDNKSGFARENYNGLESTICLLIVVLTYPNERTVRSRSPFLGQAPKRFKKETNWQSSGLLRITIHCNIPSNIWNLRWSSRPRSGVASISG